MKLLFASRNLGKLRELERLFADLDGVELVGLEAFPDAPEVVEDADTFEGNAVKKARELAARTGLPTLADDSGLEVDALGGAPGVRSARFAGEHGDDEANNARVVRELEEVPRDARTARFRCALAFVDPAGTTHVEHGVVHGRILRRPRGEGGFGYDPLFVPVGDERTTAQMPAADKDAISHRAVAARKMRTYLQARFGQAGG